MNLNAEYLARRLYTRNPYKRTARVNCDFDKYRTMNLCWTSNGMVLFSVIGKGVDSLSKLRGATIISLLLSDILIRDNVFNCCFSSLPTMVFKGRSRSRLTKIVSPIPPTFRHIRLAYNRITFSCFRSKFENKVNKRSSHLEPDINFTQNM